MTIREWALGGIAAASLTTCTACEAIPSLSQPQTVTAVHEVCLTERTAEQSAFCLIGTYAATVDELAASRERGELSPEAVKVLDVAINQTGERVAVATELWGAVAGYRAQIEAIRGGVSDGDLLAVSAQLREAVSQAQADWATLRPKLLAVINFDKTEG